MTTFGYLFVLMGVLALRQVVTGRVKDTPSDIRDLATAFLNADTDAMKTVLTARGENVAGVSAPSEVATSAETPVTPSDVPGNQAVARKTVELGNAASGYRLGATGPTYYDCSGLVWQAARAVGAYKGSRFTTSTFKSIAGSWCTRVSTPRVGDIVLWPTHHMGVLVGDDSMYSARSPSKGVGISTVSGDSSYFGSPAEYWRINA